MLPRPSTNCSGKTKFQWTQQCQAAFKHLKQALCREPIPQCPCTENHTLYTFFTDLSHYAYSSILTQAVDRPEDLKPVAFTPGLFSEMQQRLSTTKKEAYAVYQSILQFDLYLRGADYMLCCDHKLLKPFLSKGIKIPKLNRLSMESAGCNIKFVHIKGKHNILEDAISRLKILNIYKEMYENPKVQVVNNTQQVVTEVCTTSMQTISIDMLHNEHKLDNMCKKLAFQICHRNKNSSKSFTLSANGVLQKHQHIHGFQHDVTIELCSLVPTILHEFHDSTGHQ